MEQTNRSFLSVFFPPSHARLEEGKYICTGTRTGKKPLHYTIHNTYVCTYIYMRSTSRGRRLHPAEDYSNRPASAACDFHTAAVAAYNPTVVRRTRRRGQYNIIRSSLSLAPTRSVSVTLSLSHSSERPRIREAHTHAQTTRSILYVYTQAPRTVYYIYMYYMYIYYY